MTRATTARNARRGKVAFGTQLQNAFVRGRMSILQSLTSPEGLKLPDGQVARLVVHSGREMVEADIMDVPATIAPPPQFATPL